MVVQLPSSRVSEVVDVLVEAFWDYPVMTSVIGPAGDDYERRLRLLVGFFTNARVWRDDLILAAVESEEVVGAAVVTLPGERLPAPEMAVARTSLWAELGAEAYQRYDAFGQACSQFNLAEPNYHLNMIGVRRVCAGRGVGRQLLDEVHARSRADDRSVGVTLSTENAANVPMYEHVGYRVIGHARVSPELETWNFFRPDDQA